MKLTLATVALAMVSGSVLADASTFSPFVDDKGNIILPDDFRKNMSHLGSWFVPEGGASGFHDVYMDAEGVQTFRDTEKYADGSVIIKELRHSDVGNFTTGAGVAFATDKIKQTFVMIKDAKGRFKSNKNWGEGWGWGLFKPGQEGNLSTDYKVDCLGCHLPVKDKDLIYSDNYPTLNQ